MKIRRIVAGGVCLAVVAGWVTLALAQNALAGLGVNEPQAKQDIVYALTNGRVDVYPARKALKAATPVVRVALVKAAMTWAKAYTESAAFKADYDRQRAEAAPTAPAKRSVDAELAKQKAEQLKSIADMRQNIAKMPANMRPEMEAMAKQLEAQAARTNSDPQMASMMRQGLEMQIADEQARYRESVARHDQRFPADPKQLIAARLREFLETSKNVDFKATLVTADGRQRFQNPEYEEKSSEWKLCYRAGQEAVGVAREFAQGWLRSIEGK
jgi:flagellar biosynthesis GTPase FlhF